MLEERLVRGARVIHVNKLRRRRGEWQNIGTRCNLRFTADEKRCELAACKTHDKTNGGIAGRLPIESTQSPKSV